MCGCDRSFESCLVKQPDKSDKLQTQIMQQMQCFLSHITEVVQMSIVTQMCAPGGPHSQVPSFQGGRP